MKKILFVALMAIAGVVNASAFKHGSVKDPMTDVVTKYSRIYSDGGDAYLEIIWPGSKYPKVALVMPGKVLTTGYTTIGCQLRFGDEKAFDATGYPTSNGGYSAVSLMPGSFDQGAGELIGKIMTYSGTVKVMVHMDSGDKLLTFTVQQDAVTKQFSSK